MMSKLSAQKLALSFYSSGNILRIATRCRACIVPSMFSSTSRLSPLFGVSNEHVTKLSNLNGIKMHNYRAFSMALPAHKVIPMPSLSPTMETGSIVAWQKKEGDQVAEGDLLCEIETDKSVMAFESADEGFLAKILLPDGTKGIPLGKPLCIFVENEADVAAFSSYVVEGDAAPSAPSEEHAAPSATPEPKAEATPSATPVDLPQHIEVVLPALSPTMETGKVVTWHKKVGDRIVEGDLLCEIETDKSIMGFETTDEGYLANIILPDGSAGIPLGKPLCIICANEEDIPAFKNYQPSGGDPVPPPQAAAAASPPPPTVAAVSPPPPAVVAAPAVATSRPAGGRVFASPIARKIAAQKGIDLSTISGSGPGGRIIESDLKSAIGATPSAAVRTGTPAVSAATAPGGAPYVDIPLTNMRLTIAKRLLQSKQTIPHYYLCSELMIDNLIEARQKLNDSAKRDGGPKISVNDFIIKAAAVACSRVPEANSFFMNEFIRQNNTVDMCVAVSTNDGLITPIIRDAQIKGLGTISTEIKALAAKAREGKLQPNEYQGGTFTVSNLGMYGSVQNFAAVINPPQSCILAVGGVQKQLIADDAGGCKTTNVLHVTLSCDHRVVDGAVGAQWLVHFKNFMENPAAMLL